MDWHHYLIGNLWWTIVKESSEITTTLFNEVSHIYHIYFSHDMITRWGSSSSNRSLHLNK